MWFRACSKTFQFVVEKMAAENNWFLRFKCIKIAIKIWNFFHTPTFSTTKFSEDVLKVKISEHVLNRMWCKFRKNWNGSF